MRTPPVLGASPWCFDLLTDISFFTCSKSLTSARVKEFDRWVGVGDPCVARLTPE